MKILALRSVPLSEATRNAWAVAGVKFIKRHRKSQDIDVIALKCGYDAILNLGTDYENLESTIPVWNTGSVTEHLSHADLRKTLNSNGMPPVPEYNGYVYEGKHWHKMGGWGGKGVDFHDPDSGWITACLDYGGDTQVHVEGDEYRVITVGDKVVQAFRKPNVVWSDSGHSFEYEWVGVSGVSENGVVPLLKESIGRIQEATNVSRLVLGWDIIVSDGHGPYILECNISPGVNQATAQRVVKAMKAY